jgi:hypothetical protein
MQFMAGGLYQLTPAFALMGDLGWQNWKQFGQTELGYLRGAAEDPAVDLNYTNTIQMRFLDNTVSRTDGCGRSALPMTARP